MKEHPILFSEPMVQAILAGRKTQTRRVMKPQPENRSHVGSHGKSFPFVRTKKGPVKCPYGEIGDRLWVRETWTNICPAISLRKEKCSHRWLKYRADHDHSGLWKPSIYMPRWASRIMLEITGVRVERLQDISEVDAQAEGIDLSDISELAGKEHRVMFRSLWRDINGSGFWDANPWVWVIEFKRVDQ
jgi:uncharacterized protein YqfB (UPF0267 family)